MECHRCQHSAEVESGMYAGVPFTATPCGRCDLIETSAFTKPFAEDYADEMQEVEHGVIPLDDPAPLPEAVLRDFVTMVLSLSPEARDVVCWRYMGWKYVDIARAQGVTASYAELCLRRALRRHPELRALFAAKVGKQKARKERKGKR